MSLFHIYFGHVCVCKKYHKMLQYRVCVCIYIRVNTLRTEYFTLRTCISVKRSRVEHFRGLNMFPTGLARDGRPPLRKMPQIAEALCSGKLHCTEGEIATNLPITQLYISDFYDQHGACITFKSLYQNHKAIVIFVRVSQPFSCLLLVLLHT